MNLQVFKDWGEISEGDEIAWGDGTVHRLMVTRVPIRNVQSLLGKHLVYPKDYTLNGDPGWSTLIATNKISGMGWKKVIRELQYDPMQQGDKDEDI